MNNLHNIDYGKFELAAFCLENSKWIFAKTMPEHPHWYTLRKDYQFNDILPFDDLVAFMRAHSYPEMFYRKEMRRFAVNEMKYWTMGAPIPETILINKAVIEGAHSYYDNLSGEYDGMYQGEKCLNENDQVSKLINYQSGSVLDIGCGTGLAIDLMEPESYQGVDPSSGMIQELRAKYGEEVEATCSKFEQWYSPETFDYVIALFGAASYVDPRAWSRLNKALSAGGKYFLMFYAPEYEPAYYEEVGTPSRVFDLDTSLLPGCRVIDLNNYQIATNIGEV